MKPTCITRLSPSKAALFNRKRVCVNQNKLTAYASNTDNAGNSGNNKSVANISMRLLKSSLIIRGLFFNTNFNSCYNFWRWSMR